jgi:hypothetical protein
MLPTTGVGDQPTTSSEIDIGREERRNKISQPHLETGYDSEIRCCVAITTKRVVTLTNLNQVVLYC